MTVNVTNSGRFYVPLPLTCREFTAAGLTLHASSTPTFKSSDVSYGALCPLRLNPAANSELQKSRRDRRRRPLNSDVRTSHQMSSAVRQTAAAVCGSSKRPIRGQGLENHDCERFLFSERFFSFSSLKDYNVPTEFGVDSSSRFHFRAQTDRQTEKHN